jgi:cell division protease FtsH
VPGNDPLHKVTIIPRGRALGVTMNLPERDRYALRKSEIEARLAMTFGGRVAEELIFGAGDVTTGASNDIQQATQLARRMVTEWGMSDVLGRLRYSDTEEQIFLGRSFAQTRSVSDDTARIIDGEVRRIIEEAENRARQVLTEHLDDLHAVAEALLEHETMSGDEVRAVLAGQPIVRNNPADDDRPAGHGTVPSAGRGDWKRPRPVIGRPQPQT